MKGLLLLMTSRLTYKNKLKKDIKNSFIHTIDVNKKVIVVVVKTLIRFKPGGSKISPHTMFVTDKLIIIRNSLT